MMKTVCEFNMCAGCMACIDICPQKAIKIEDTAFSYNAVKIEDKCTDCGLCEKACPQNCAPIKREPIAWCEGWALDDRVRKSSTSGGYAAAVTDAFIKSGGDVCSCVFENGEFVFRFAEQLENKACFSGSKYVKSNPLGAYSAIKERLKSGKKVLFIGLPCQVAALVNFIKAPLCDNLFTIDIICHGTPSPKILDGYLAERGIDKETIKNIAFRDDNNYRLSADGVSVGIKNVTDSYNILFLKGAIFTENCYSCRYAGVERVADLTLGDSWGSNLPKEEFKKGVSLALCQTEKGTALLDMAEIERMDVDIKKAIMSNAQLNSPMLKPQNRDAVIGGIMGKKTLGSLAFKYYFTDSAKQLIKAFLIKIKLKKI